MTGALFMRKVGETQIELTRLLRAPVERVFAALTEPALLKRWLYSDIGDALLSCVTDLRPGGQTVFTWRAPSESGMSCLTVTWIEIEPPTRLVSHQVFSDWPDGAINAAFDLKQQGAQTLYTSKMTHGSADVRNATYSTPLFDHLEMSFCRLDAVFAAEVSVPSRPAAPDDA